MADPSPELSTYFAILPQTSEEKILRLLIELGCQVVDANEGALLLLDRGSKELVFSMVVGTRTGKEGLTGKRVPLGKGLTGLAAATREVQVGAPAFRDLGQSRSGVAGGDSGMAVIAAPMLAGEELVGVLTAVSFREGARFGSRESALYGRFALVAGLVVEQRRRLADAADLEGSKGGQTQFTRSLSQRDVLEQKIVHCVGRLVRTRPSSLEHVARILESVEKMLPAERT